MTYNIRPPAAPAPLPYSSQAGRGAIPPAPITAPADQHFYDPAAPLLRDDEFTFWVTTGFVGFFIVLMTLISLTGGL